MKIHPTALVGSEVSLGENVEIGPYAIVEDGVVIGDHCKIQARAILINGVTLGSRNDIGPGAIIGGAPQDFSHDPNVASKVIVGDGNTFREYVTIHRGTKEGSVTRVGDENYFMAGVHLGHNVSVGDRNVIANNCLLAGHIHLGDDAVLGGGAVFHQFLRIGSMCMIRGGTAWSKDIPPYAVGVAINSLCGINAIGMRRKGVNSSSRASVKQAYHLLYRSGLNVTQAIAAAEETDWSPEAKTFMDFVRQRSRRGLCDGHGPQGSD